MANKSYKNVLSTSLVIWDVPIQTSTRFHYSPRKTAKMWKLAMSDIRTCDRATRSVTHHWQNRTLGKPVWLYLLRPNKHYSLRSNNYTPRNIHMRNDGQTTKRHIQRYPQHLNHNSWKLGTTRSLWTAKRITTLWHYILQQSKRARFCCMEQHRYICQAERWTKARHKRVHAVRFYLYKAQAKQNLSRVTGIRVMISRETMGTGGGQKMLSECRECSTP